MVAVIAPPGIPLPATLRSRLTAAAGRWVSVLTEPVCGGMKLCAVAAAEWAGAS